MVETLRALFLFETFSDEQLHWLVGHTQAISFQIGDQVFRENQPSDALWVLIVGEWELSQHVNGVDLPFITTSQPGTWAGGIPLVGGAYQISVRTTQPSQLLRISAEAVQHMLASGFPIAPHLLSGVTSGARRMGALQSQQEKLAALGKLSAGLAHELNNPAAAAQRASSEFRQVVHDLQDAVVALAPNPGPAGWNEQLHGLRTEIAAAVQETHALSPLDRADREDIVVTWLEDNQIADSYEVAASLVDLGFDSRWLEGISNHVAPALLPGVLRWVIVTAKALSLAEQVEQSVSRISTLIAAVKSYTYMDQAPVQDVDIHEGLESTLTILGHKCKGITVQRNYDRDLPRLTAFGSELNQVWTNLMDNAIDAMGGEGRMTVRTARELEHMLVEIGDDGPGVPEEIQSRIFEPFFTSKGVGKGTGLGLDIAYRIVVNRHHGDIRVVSQPGDTRFQVRLPLQWHEESLRT